MSTGHIQPSIRSAIAMSGGNADIKIRSNLYDEQLLIEQPGITLMPKERGGEVTLRQKQCRCICVDIGQANVCTIKKLRMLLRGPNVDADIHSF